MIRIGVVGFGTVGQGFVELLAARKSVVEKLVGEFRIVFVADSKSSISGSFSISEAIEMKRRSGRLRDDRTAMELIKEEDFDVLVECSVTKLDGGDGLRYIREALKKGCHVVTSNKGPLVAAYDELMKLASQHGVELMYEATVGGAMPVIRLARKYLAACTIERVSGVLNGTCNYILSRMEEEGLPYERVLSEAQELGIAEADPSYDVEGIDAAAKLVILANTVGIRARYEDVERKGISSITPEAFRIAAEKGYTIRLIAEASRKRLLVAPRLVRKSHPLSLRGTMNAVVFNTAEAGSIAVAGRGAGKYETASAMISDLVDIYAG